MRVRLRPTEAKSRVFLVFPPYDGETAGGCQCPQKHDKKAGFQKGIAGGLFTPAEAIISACGGRLPGAVKERHNGATDLRRSGARERGRKRLAPGGGPGGITRKNGLFYRFVSRLADLHGKTIIFIRFPHRPRRVPPPGRFTRFAFQGAKTADLSRFSPGGTFGRNRPILGAVSDRFFVIGLYAIY